MKSRLLSVVLVLMFLMPVFALAGTPPGLSVQEAEAARRRPTRTPRPTSTPLPTATPSDPTATPSGPTPTPAPGPASAWTLVDSPNVNNRSNYLYGLTAISATHLWAVGEHRTSNGSNVQTLTMHWNGNNWQSVASPNPDLNRNLLRAVDAVGANDVWAVGQSGGATGPNWRALILRGDGSGWETVPAPHLGDSGTSELRGVSALAANDVWAVGAFSSPASGWWNQPLVLHWNGVQWSAIPAPTFGTTAELNAVVALAANDVWAVGTALESNWRSLILHWNGVTWSRVVSPNLGPYGNYLYAIDATPDGELWAVGAANNGNSTLALRWTGSAWSLVPSPNGAGPGINRNAFYGVTALAADDVWAVGQKAYASVGSAGQPIFVGYALIEHWDGNAWQEVPAAGLPGTGEDGVLRAIAALSGADDGVWAAGSYYEPALSVQAQRTLIQRYLE